MHEKSAERQLARIRDYAEQAKHPDRRKAEHARRFLDMWLEHYADSLLRATEWDADQWGFDPDRWMAKERLEIAKRGGRDWPREVI